MRFTLAFILFWGAIAQSQDLKLQLLASIPQKADYIATDKLQQWYTVSKGYHIQKYNADGTFAYQYGENNLGKISLIDASNPLQLLVYYSDYSVVLMLDRTLSPLHRIDLSAAGIWRSQALCISNDNQIWLYDPQSFLLQKINAHGEILQESPDLSLLSDGDFNPDFLIESNNFLYLNEPSQGIFVFDNFGNYMRTIPLLGLSQFQIRNNQLIYLSDKKTFNFLDINSLEKTSISLPSEFKSALQIILTQERLCLRYADKVEWYSWKR